MQPDPSNAPKNTWLPVSCDDCGGDGFIQVADLEGQYYIACAHGSHMTSSVWCSNCGMGGAFVSDISAKPTAWRCPKCKTEYQLPEDFYLHPVRMYQLATLPQAEQQKWQPKRLSPAVYILVIVFIVVDFIITVLLPNR